MDISPDHSEFEDQPTADFDEFKDLESFQVPLSSADNFKKIKSSSATNL